MGLDVSHHFRISQRGGEKLFLLTSSFIGVSVIAIYQQSRQTHQVKPLLLKAKSRIEYCLQGDFFVSRW